MCHHTASIILVVSYWISITDSILHVSTVHLAVEGTRLQKLLDFTMLPVVCLALCAIFTGSRSPVRYFALFLISHQNLSTKSSSLKTLQQAESQTMSQHSFSCRLTSSSALQIHFCYWLRFYYIWIVIWIARGREDSLVKTLYWRASIGQKNRHCRSVFHAGEHCKALIATHCEHMSDSQALNASAWRIECLEHVDATL